MKSFGIITVHSIRLLSQFSLTILVYEQVCPRPHIHPDSFVHYRLERNFAKLASS